VEKAQVRFNSGKSEVEHDPTRSSVDALVEVVRGAGHEARPSAF
jgi:copper chaperone